MIHRVLFLLLLMLFTPLSSAVFSQQQQQQEKSEPKQQDKPEFKAQFPKETLSETKHTINIGGKSVSYKATAGNLLLKEENGRPKANIFFIAYMREGVADRGKRAITFSFNGGPGSSSVWLHLGALGPRRVLMTDEGKALPPPYKLVNNEYSILDASDLVFIDPVTTGFSRAVPGETDRQYHGVVSDIESVGEFIRLYVSRFERWGSPKFLIGESYGTTRAAGLSYYLLDRFGMYLNGVMLVSSILNFQTADFHPGNDLPYILFLPTYTATAWFHKKLPQDLQSDLPKTLQQAEEFALNEYSDALMKGNRLTAEETKRIAQKVARFTGLSEDFILRSNLRIEDYRFNKELLRAERKTVGRLDSRFTGMDVDYADDETEYDPSYAAIYGPYTATLNAYVRSELKYESDLPYEILTGRVRPWDYSNAKNKYLNVAEDLRRAMTENPSMKVFVANGYYDLATPYYATTYTFDHLGIDPLLQKHVSMGFYESGHMMYIHMPSLKQFKADLAKFIVASQ